ncbi:MAG: hypothetical protein EAZ89_12530 [Bacteroidetes bacterium]|nr:MAG: hypothetical protein EAZ89_12530 [Bacteroidota bacterium]
MQPYYINPTLLLKFACMKLWIPILFLCMPAGLLAQQTTVFQDTSGQSNRIQILNSDILSYSVESGVGIQKLIGHVRLKQDSSYFNCDSAYLYEVDNRFEAFSRIKIEMPDSVFLYGDRVTYDGNTRIAEVYNKIRLLKQKSVLTTNRLTYYRNEDYGYYQGGGKLVDGETVLNSEYGYYYPNRKEAFFKRKVELKNPDYTLYTDTLAYDTETKVARFVTFTRILSEDGEVETTKGTYDTEAGIVNLFKRSTVKDSTYQITADTLFYTDKGNKGTAQGRVIIEQEDSSLQIRGNYGQFNRETDESMLTLDPVAIQTFDDDTLYIFADTLRTYSDTLDHKMFKAYYHVRFFMNEMQGRADSLMYFYDDSLIYLYGDPVIWSKENQLTGDTIAIWMKNQEADSMWVGGAGFLAAKEDTIGFNQIKGKEFQAKFKDNQISRLHVTGNSESIYFVRDDKDSVNVSYQGMNQALSQEMFIYFEDNEVSRILFLAKPEGTFSPYFEVYGKPNELEGMKWRISEKPDKPVFPDTLPPPDSQNKALP